MTKKIDPVDEYRHSCFYTDLPPGRQSVGRLLTKEKWEEEVRKLISPDARVSVELYGDIRIGSSEWQQKLRDLILTNGWRMWWEPRPASQKEKAPRTIENLFGIYPQGTPDYSAWMTEERAQRQRFNARKRNRLSRRQGV